MTDLATLLLTPLTNGEQNRARAWLEGYESTTLAMLALRGAMLVLEQDTLVHELDTALLALAQAELVTM